MCALNTGRVGGLASDERSKRIRFEDAFAIVEAIADGSIAWDGEGDLGADIAREVPGVDDIELLQPRRLYERQGRLDEYHERVRLLGIERRILLTSLPRFELPSKPSGRSR
jgi:phosphoenolpyruvate carboxykinase (ATP)